jgi:hypothetical protein
MSTIIKQSETFRRALKFNNLKTGAVIDLTGCEAYSQMRKHPKGELLGTAICAIDITQGIITATWSKEQTAEFPVGQAGYDIWLVSGDEQKPIYTETVEIIAGYTENMGE